MLTGTNLTHAKQYNLRIVHEAIRKYGPVSRTEIARRTELSVQTVSNLAKELLDAGLILETERRQSGRGAPSIGLVLNPEGAFSIGLDLNRDHLTGVLVDLAGVVRQRVVLEVDFPPPDEALELLTSTTEALIERESLPRERVWGVGVGIPGPMHPAPDGHGYIVNPKAFPGWHNVPLATRLRERLEIPVYLENNATAAAIGERWYGAGQHISTFFFFHFGSGLGGGLVIQGQPFRGSSGNAGEIGYIPTVLSSVPGAHGDSLHVGQHFSLPRLYAALRAEGFEARSPDDLARLLGEGNRRMRDWMDTAGDYLTSLVLAVEYMFDPDAIFLGGRFPTLLLHGLMERVTRHLPVRRIVEKQTSPRLLLATAGMDAAALGVATLPIHASFAPALNVLLKQAKRREGARLLSHGLGGP